MRFDGALIKEQGQKFAVVVVNPSVQVGGQQALQKAAASFAPAFGNVPVALMWQDAHGTPSYWGRRDIADFLAKLHISQIPWRTYTMS